MMRTRYINISKRCSWTNVSSKLCPQQQQQQQHARSWDLQNTSSSSSALHHLNKKYYLSTSTIDNIWESGKGLLSLLTDQQRTLLAEQKKISREALNLAKKVGGVDLQHCATTSFLEQILTPNNDSDDAAIADRVGSEEVLDSTFSVVIAGEFNAGKSTLINALLGQKLLETGALPTTDQITVLTCDQQKRETENTSGSSDPIHVSNKANQSYNVEMTGYAHSNAIILHRLPVSNLPLLGDLTLIDTPGTNAVMSNHTERTLKLLPSADLILFVTSADRPFPESERKLLQSIQSYRKNIVIVINKMDVLDAAGGDHGEEEKQKVAQFVADHAADLLGARAVVMPISAKDALAAKLIHGMQSDGKERGDYTETSKVWKRSNFSTLETFLKESLTEETKVQAKLLNPLGVTEGMLKECAQVLNARNKDLETDAATVNLFRNQMDSWKRDMDLDMSQFQNDVGDLLEKEMERCRNFVSELGFIERHALLFMGGDAGAVKLEGKWNDTRSITIAISDNHNVQKELLNITRECSDSIATSSRAQGQAVIEYLGKRPAVVGQNLIGSVTAASRFEDTRKDLCEKMSLAVHNVFATYKEDEEKMSIFQSLKSYSCLSAGVNTLALSSGMSTALEVVDVVPGAAATCILIMVGVGIVPLTNQRIIKDYESRWKQRDEKLQAAFESLCSKEIARIHQKILNGVSPYTRYVKTEEESIASFREDCDKLTNSTQILRNRIIKSR